MELNERQNPFNYGFFTKESDELSYALYIEVMFEHISAYFSIYKEKLPDDITPYHIPKLENFKYNTETGNFTSKIGDGKIIFNEKKKFKIIFSNFKYNDTPNLELNLNTKLNEAMSNHKDNGLKI